MHDDPHETIGFIGIGTMGARMAMRLLDAGFEVLVWNRTPDRCEALVARGAEEVDSVPELVEAPSAAATMTAAGTLPSALPVLVEVPSAVAVQV
jgi:3-hydroxyisobutyrate dehydrogenase-like beta-hydroxyacid dehydrogenase